MNKNEALKRMLAFLLTMAMLTVLSACSFGVVSDKPTLTVHSGEEVTAVTLSPDKRQEETATTVFASEADATAAATTQPLTATDNRHTSAADTTNEATTTQESKTKKRHAETTAKNKNNTSMHTDAKEKQNLCTITVQCTAILENMDRLSPGKEAYVPQDGYLIHGCSVEFNKGDTAYDILERACAANHIKITAQKTVYGTYVAGINQICEFDVGKESGWMYKVNGTVPMVACDKYEIAQNDSIDFYYTCKK